MYASRSRKETKCNYTQIEKELLAVVFKLERFENYTYGEHIVVESDHEPLDIIHKKNLHNAQKEAAKNVVETLKI